MFAPVSKYPHGKHAVKTKENKDMIFDDRDHDHKYHQMHAVNHDFPFSQFCNCMNNEC